MILPSKHVKLAESYIGLSGFVLKILKVPMTIDELWQKFNKFNDSEQFPAYHSIDNVILSVNLLYLMGAITIDDQNKLSYAAA